MTSTASSAACLLVCVALQACSADGPLAVGRDAGGLADAGVYDVYIPVGTPVVHTYAPTYSAVYDEILSPTCATAFCHGTVGSFMDLSTRDVGYASLVDAASSGPACGDSGVLRVDPGHPGSSLVYLKVTNPPCGQKMPAYEMPLDALETSQIFSWIEAGAPNN